LTELPLESGFFRLGAAALPLGGLALVALTVLAIVRRLRDDSESTGPIRFWASAVLVGALGGVLMWIPYAGHAVRSLVVSPGRIELRYLWPRAPIVLENATLATIEIRVHCRRSRSGRTLPSYNLSFELDDGRHVDGLSGSREEIFGAARTMAARAGLGGELPGAASPDVCEAPAWPPAPMALPGNAPFGAWPGPYAPAFAPQYAPQFPPPYVPRFVPPYVPHYVPRYP